MANPLNSRHQINTELAARRANIRAKHIIEEHTPSEEKAELTIDFHCECSDPACQERVTLTLEEYEKLHSEQSEFVIAKGHESPLVEKVTKTKGNVQVVEKFAL